MLGLYFAGPTIQFTNLSGLACLFWGNRIECCGIHLCGDFILSKVNRVNKWWWFWDSNHQLRTTGLNALELIHIRDWVFSGVITIIITCKYVKLLNKDGVKIMFVFFSVSVNKFWWRNNNNKNQESVPAEWIQFALPSSRRAAETSICYRTLYLMSGYQCAFSALQENSICKQLSAAVAPLKSRLFPLSAVSLSAPPADGTSAAAAAFI